jgi:protein gp37
MGEGFEGDKRMTTIEWTDLTLNPIIGCSHAGYAGADGRKHAHPGCENCYAEAMCSRKLPGFEAHNACTKGGKWSGDVKVLHERLTWPFTRKEYAPRKDGKQRRVFLTSLSDAGHPALALQDWMAIQGMMVLAPWLTWQDLTKRPDIQAERLRKHSPIECVREALRRLDVLGCEAQTVVWMVPGRALMDLDGTRWEDIRHIHRYVSVSDQSTADALIPALLQMPAAVRGVSLEPMIGPVDLTPWLGHLQHVIVGGESGRNARPCDLAWILSVVRQCKAAGVPCFVKQMGAKPVINGVPTSEMGSKGQNFGEWPVDLQVREEVR